MARRATQKSAAPYLMHARVWSARLLAGHFELLARVYEERYEPTHGSLRPVVSQMARAFSERGHMQQAFARERCASC